MDTTTNSPFKARRLAAGLRQIDIVVAADCSMSYIGFLDAGYVPKRGGDVYRRVLATVEQAERDHSDD